MKITKAIIPAAGFGFRMYPISKAVPKALIPVVDRPAIQYIVDEAINAGCTDIAIIVSKEDVAIEKYFTTNIDYKFHTKTHNGIKIIEYYSFLVKPPKITIIKQNNQYGLGEALLCAENFCNGEPFVVLLGDTICLPENNKSCTSQMIETYNKYNRPVIVVKSIPNDKLRDYGIIEYNRPTSTSELNITDIVEKPNPNEAPSNLAIIGRYVLFPEIFAVLKSIEPDKNGEIQLTAALRKIKDNIGIITEFKYYDIGNIRSWHRSNFEIALNNPVLYEDYISMIKENNLK